MIKSTQTIWIVIFFLIGCGVVYFYNGSLVGILSLLAMAGAFGGLLYTIRDSGLELIHRDATLEKGHIINLGWLADCAYGIAGAFVVFLIIPTDLNDNLLVKPLFDRENALDLIKFLSLALVGGYGGRSLVDRALANVAKDAQEAKSKSTKAQQEVEQMKAEIDKKNERDSRALENFYAYMNDEESNVDIESLKSDIADASILARYDILKETRKKRREGYKESDASTIESTIPIFEALIASDVQNKYHRNHGQLGYALWDAGNLTGNQDYIKRAHLELTTAIRLRDESGKQGFLYYEFVRAMCKIKLNDTSEDIIADIIKASSNPSLNTKIRETEIFKSWAENNQFNLEKLK